MQASRGGVREFVRRARSPLAAIPGLISKLWLADRAERVFGGVYNVRVRGAVDEYPASDLFAGIGSRPGLKTSLSRWPLRLHPHTRVTCGSGTSVVVSTRLRSVVLGRT